MYIVSKAALYFKYESHLSLTYYILHNTKNIKPFYHSSRNIHQIDVLHTRLQARYWIYCVRKWKHEEPGSALNHAVRYSLLEADLCALLVSNVSYIKVL